jgi:hypothetical protein
MRLPLTTVQALARLLAESEAPLSALAPSRRTRPTANDTNDCIIEEQGILQVCEASDWSGLVSVKLRGYSGVPVL